MGNCIEMDSLTLPEVENANVGSLNLLPERSKMLYQKTYDESVAWCGGKLVVRNVKESLLPSKSRHLYEETYNLYRKWCSKKNVKSTSEESILAYFTTELSWYKSSSLWSKYSMLRSTINLREGVDINKFPGVIAFLKRKGEGYRPKKSLTLTKSQIEFIKADSKIHLLNKVVIIFGVAGACRRQELVTLLTTCVKDCKTHILVNLQDTKTKTDRHFVIVPGNMENINLVELVRAYMALRTIKTPHQKFFINYVKEKCTVQAVGIHKIGNVPAVAAKYLGLENASSYTGHCFRRSSATILATVGCNMEGIKRHRGWGSLTVAEGYVDDCETAKINVAEKILAKNLSDKDVAEDMFSCGKPEAVIEAKVAKCDEENTQYTFSGNSYVVNIKHCDQA
ncbi:hypothetical protein Zmor_006398 [Zophobas morio]|uniref:Tyr recombinase domain-containing protein n=1 Tax=Zophobas morio TaxID=2755281 RepID=A0AA38MMS7_9CUCU|nr:hypothetical protein Zmor_006398 [Zophobas morio]